MDMDAAFGFKNFTKRTFLAVGLHSVAATGIEDFRDNHHDKRPTLNSKQRIRRSASESGVHNVLLVNPPDLRMGGIVVVDSGSLDDLARFEERPERFVVITRKGLDNLSKVWDAGVRHVVFEEDSPSTAQLAVIAAELRLAQPAVVSARPLASHSRDQKCRMLSHSELIVLNPAVTQTRCCHFRRGHRIPER
jgi:hypothetical protein